MQIQLSAINCFYGNQQVLFDINYSVTHGSTVALLGPSGAGKSTLLKVFNLLARPSSGTISLLGHAVDFSASPAEKEINLIRRKVGLVFQQYNLWPHMKIMDNLIEAPCRVLKIAPKEAREQAEELLQRLGLSTQTNRYPIQLSGGQQQRVAIARALMMKPQVLLFDEPTAALDPEITAQFATIVGELAQSGITQLLVTHDLDIACKVATHIVYMEHGSILECGGPELLKDPKSDQLRQYLAHGEVQIPSPQLDDW